MRRTWPEGPPQQLHLDLTVPGVQMTSWTVRTIPEQPLRVYADPAGHPFCFCIFSFEPAAG